MYTEKKRYENEIKLLQKLEKQKRELYQKPTLSKNSQDIIKNKFNNVKPIYKRTKDIILKKNEKFENLKKNVEEEKKLSERIPPKCGIYDKERNDKWIAEQIEWKKNIKTKMSDINKNRDRIETEGQNLLYKPTINKFSETLANLRNNETPNRTIHERLYNEKDSINQTMYELKKTHCSTFHPKLNKPAKKGRIDTEFNRSMLETKSNYNPILTKYTVTRENKRPKSQEHFEDYKNENPDEDWRLVIDEINTKKLLKNKDKDSYLYKLNLRCTSAWEKDHLNEVTLNDKMIELFSDQI
jgi:hypothetical protein